MRWPARWWRRRPKRCCSPDLGIDPAGRSIRRGPAAHRDQNDDRLHLPEPLGLLPSRFRIVGKSRQVTIGNTDSLDHAELRPEDGAHYQGHGSGNRPRPAMKAMSRPPRARMACLPVRRPCRDPHGSSPAISANSTSPTLPSVSDPNDSYHRPASASPSSVASSEGDTLPLGPLDKAGLTALKARHATAALAF